MESETDRKSDSQEVAAQPLSEVEERPTLKTIARLAGLAVPTISRALSDAPDIGEDTKKRVREIASRIGYRPNRAGVRLRTGKTHMISLILSTEHDMMNHTARLVSSISGALRGTAYHLVITPYFPPEDPMTPIRYIVETGSADGIIMNQIEPRDPRVAYLMERDFPFATHGRTDWQHPGADFDNRAFGEITVRMLAQRGRKRIALLRPPATQAYSIHMAQGAKRTAQELGLEYCEVAGATSDSASDMIEQAMRPYFAGSDAVDGLITPSATSTMAAVTAAEDCGLVLGRDFDIAAKEPTNFLRRFRREILVVHEDVGRVGTFLAEALLHRIAHPQDLPMQYLEVPTLPVG